MQHVEYFLSALERESRNDDVAASRKGAADGGVEFVDRFAERAVKPISVSRFHHDKVGPRWRCGRAQQRASGAADIPGEEDRSNLVAFAHLNPDAGRTENMPGI